YAKEVRVWSGIITKELETAREQAVPFIRFTEKYATDNQDMVRALFAQKHGILLMKNGVT
ncbi:MAG TPA: hypothetical protein VN258_13110, partial [Mobilitalea sp.]|nr:hypothetical protein [Mobilitalea sp.]